MVCNLGNVFVNIADFFAITKNSFKFDVNLMLILHKLPSLGKGDASPRTWYQRKLSPDFATTSALLVSEI